MCFVTLVKPCRPAAPWLVVQNSQQLQRSCRWMNHFLGAVCVCVSANVGKGDVYSCTCMCTAVCWQCNRHKTRWPPQTPFPHFLSTVPPLSQSLCSSFFSHLASNTLQFVQVESLCLIVYFSQINCTQHSIILSTCSIRYPHSSLKMPWRSPCLIFHFQKILFTFFCQYSGPPSLNIDRTFTHGLLLHVYCSALLVQLDFISTTVISLIPLEDWHTFSFFFFFSIIYFTWNDFHQWGFDRGFTSATAFKEMSLRVLQRPDRKRPATTVLV